MGDKTGCLDAACWVENNVRHQQNGNQGACLKALAKHITEKCILHVIL